MDVNLQVSLVMMVTTIRMLLFVNPPDLVIDDIEAEYADGVYVLLAA